MKKFFIKDDGFTVNGDIDKELAISRKIFDKKIFQNRLANVKRMFPLGYLKASQTLKIFCTCSTAIYSLSATR